MTSRWSKPSLKEELVARIRGDLETLLRAQRATREAATHEEAKPENDKDTRALEQSYLARGQALRAEELKTALAEVTALPVRTFVADDPVAIGALATVEVDGQERVLLIASQGGGALLAGGEVQVVTPKSPLGRALIGKRAGEDCETDLAGRLSEVILSRVE